MQPPVPSNSLLSTYPNISKHKLDAQIRLKCSLESLDKKQEEISGKMSE